MKFFLILLLANYTHATELKGRSLAPRAKDCTLCHIKRTTRETFVPSKNVTKREHFEIQIAHGSLKKACNDCHDVNNSNQLFLPATFENTTPLCARCHAERVLEWKMGRHGKKIGSWDNSKALQFQCIECHNPHSVSFKKMEAKPAPHLRLYEEKKEE